MFEAGVEYGFGHIASNNVAGVLSWFSGGDIQQVHGNEGWKWGTRSLLGDES